MGTFKKSHADTVPPQSQRFNFRLPKKRSLSVRVDLGISPFSSELMFGAPENMEKHIKTIYSPSETMKNSPVT
jgi:hypothetical protein